MDGLTGAFMFDRVGLERMGERVLMRARQSQRSVSVVMVDADFFKLINDTCGHPAGDQVNDCAGYRRVSRHDGCGSGNLPGEYWWQLLGPVRIQAGGFGRESRCRSVPCQEGRKKPGVRG